MQKAFVSDALKVGHRLLLIGCMLIACSFRLSAKRMAEQEPDIRRVYLSLNSAEVPLNKLFTEIEKQTNFRFFYDAATCNVQQPVNIRVKHESLFNVLQILKKNTGLEFKQIEHYFSVRPVNKSKSTPAPAGIIAPELSTGTAIDKANDGEIVVKGKVTDETGAPLIGVSVQLKGTTSGMSTDGQGSYSLRVPADGTLIFSFMGYEKREVKINGASVLNISLTGNSSGLNEVVVVGYTKQKKISIVGSLVTVTGDELKQSPASNLSNALAGRLPGLIAMQQSGSPGADQSKILIRGYSTSGDNSPLILIDGVERSMDNVDVQEIESITVLKDASATAQYGIRGANGVVVVTTRRGKAGPPRIDFSANYALNQATQLPKFLDSYNYGLLLNEALANDGKPAQFTPEQLEQYKAGKDPLNYPNTDWVNLLFRETSPTQRYNLNINGGNQNVKYFVSAAYLNQQGILRKYDNPQYDTKDVFRRWNFRSNIDIALSKDFNISVDLAGVITSKHSPTSSVEGDMLRQVYWYPPTELALLPDGKIAVPGNHTQNPIGDLSRTGYTETFDGTAQGTIRAIRKLDFITEGLSTGLNYSFDRTYTYRSNRTQGYGLYRWDPATGQSVLEKGADTPVEPITEFSSSPRYALNFEYYLNYNQTFGKHNVTGMVLYNQRKRVEQGAQYGKPFYVQGVMSRLTYGYNNKYFIDLNGRYDGSENFPKGSRFGFFPSIAAGWVVTGEEFMKPVTALTYLKLRGSYGVVGNDQIGGRRFLWQSIYQAGSGYSFGQNGEVWSAGLKEGSTGTPEVTWEKHKIMNLGLEAKLFNDKLGINLDVFRKNVSDILITPGTIVATYGGPLPALNMGETKSHGFELELIHTNQINKDLSYMVKGNLNFTTSKVIYADEPPRKYPWLQRTGHPINQYFGYQSLGFFQSQDDIDKSATQFGGLIPGDIKYADLNNDGQVNADDQTAIGKTDIPTHTMGFSMGLNYKSFDFSVLFQGAFGAYTVLQNFAAYEFYSNGKVSERHLGRWTPATAATATFPALHASDNTNNHVYSDFWMKRADYVRLKNFEIGYRLPKSWTDRVKIQGVRFYVNGQNLWTWMKDMKDFQFDPEAPSGDGTFYPQQKIYNFGATVTF
ncbi:TonB-dependent receptor [Chitinophaga defluvii]|uniref:TonB-dependent receptor n=1 Tax=Chitinophaga defluvii TaxID=3163343 RepID=A0ABV2TA59_9BACT